jgi:hypothetical protein
MAQSDEFTLKFKKADSGLWFVTSEDEPSLFIAHRSIEAILCDFPAIMKQWLKRHGFQEEKATID